VSDLARQNLLRERSTYLHLSRDFACTNTFEWWRNIGAQIPNHQEVAKSVFLLTPSSASCERVFSIFNATHNKRQHALLMDSIEAGLLLRMNTALQDFSDDFADEQEGQNS
jgi:hypothetical protein